jgi:hypothetical protein
LNAIKDWEDGLTVIPLIKGTKVAAVKWRVYQSRRPTREEMMEWVIRYWQGNPNYGILCVNGLTVLDFEEFEVYQRYFPVTPKTRVVRTPHGGVHVYFYAVTPYMRRMKFKDYEYLGAGYVVGPGSIVDGVKYEFISNAPILKTDLSRWR